jgi:hypothetical protein
MGGGKMKVIMITIKELKEPHVEVIFNNLSREDATPKEQAIAEYFENLYLANVNVLNPVSTKIIKK